MAYDQLASLELTHRFAQRTSSNAQLSSQPGFANPGSRRKLATENRHFELLDQIVDKRAGSH